MEIKKDEKTTQNRREFLKYTAGMVASFLVVSPFKNITQLAWAGPAPLKATDPMAVAMGYNPNADKVDTKKWPKKAGAEGKTQTCSNCMFYSATDKTTGKCQIFPNNTVLSKGWCNTWSKKV